MKSVQTLLHVLPQKCRGSNTISVTVSLELDHCRKVLDVHRQEPETRVFVAKNSDGEITCQLTLLQEVTSNAQKKTENSHLHGVNN